MKANVSALFFVFALLGLSPVVRAQGEDPLTSTICYANPYNAENYCYAESDGYVGYVEVEIGGVCYYCVGAQPSADSSEFWACAETYLTGVSIGNSGWYSPDGIWLIGYVQSNSMVGAGNIILNQSYGWEDCYGNIDDTGPSGYEC
jgi:hypothetical protein